MRHGQLLVLLIALALSVLPALAHASPPDPLWIAGIYDAADHDDAVAAVASTEAGAVVGGPVFGGPRMVAGAVAPCHPDPPRSSVRPAFEGRAPPPAV